MNTPLRVLVIDDAEADYRIMLHYLKEGGFDPESRWVDNAGSLAAALDGESWDVILCDYRIPGFGAEPALAMVQERGLDVPFIILSGVVRANEVASLVRKGAHDFLEKDRLDQLVPAVERELCEVMIRREGHKPAAEQEPSDILYRTLLMEAPDAMLLSDTEGRFIDVNRKAEELLGYSREEFLTLSYPALHPEWILDKTRQAFEAVVETGAGGMPRGMIRCKDGTEVPVVINARVVTIGEQRIVQAIFHPLSVD